MVWIKINQNETDKLIELQIIMDPETQTLNDIKQTINSLGNLFLGIQKQQIAYTKPVKHVKTIKLDDETLQKILDKIMAEINDTPIGRSNKRMYSIPLKKRIIEFVKLYQKLYPSKTYRDISEIIGISAGTFAPWMVGRHIKIKKQRLPKKHYPKTLLSADERQKRNNEIIEYANKNPYDSWDEMGEKFKMSNSAIYQICKKSRKVKIMNRPWERIIDKSKLSYKKVKPAPITPAEKKTPVEAFLNFENSNVSQGETIKAINECISKGKLTYRDDAHKFGFDRRSLPNDNWFKFITEVAKKTNNMIGVEVTLSNTMTGLEFKK